MGKGRVCPWVELIDKVLASEWSSVRAKHNTTTLLSVSFSLVILQGVRITKLNAYASKGFEN